MSGIFSARKNLAQIKKGKNYKGAGGVCLLINLEVEKIRKISEPSVPSAFFPISRQALT